MARKQRRTWFLFQGEDGGLDVRVTSDRKVVRKLAIGKPVPENCEQTLEDVIFESNFDKCVVLAVYSPGSEQAKAFEAMSKAKRYISGAVFRASGAIARAFFDAASKKSAA